MDGMLYQNLGLLNACNLRMIW